MADIEISNLNLIEEVEIGDVLAIDNISAGETKKIPFESLQGEVININPAFDIWQEEDDFTNPATTVYTADGYYITSSTGGGTLPTVNVKKNTVNMETAFVQCCELEITNIGTVGTTRIYIISQKVEDYKKYAGKTVVLSIRVKASTAIALSGGRMMIHDGIAAQSVAIASVTTSWVTYKVPITVNSGATQIWARFDLLSGSNSTISTTGSIYVQWMQLELGSVATPLIPAKTADSLDDAQRNYQKTYAQGVFPGAATEIGAVWQEYTGVASADHTITIDVKFPKVMKAAPTIVLYDLAGNSGRVTMAAGDNIVGTVSQISDSGFKISATNGAAATSRKIAFHYTAISRP